MVGPLTTAQEQFHMPENASHSVAGASAQPPVPVAHQLDVNGLFRALAHPMRRDVLRHLTRTDTPITVDKLAAHLEAHKTASNPSPTDQSAYTVALTQIHLPYLADANLIERTPRNHVIATDLALNALYVLDVATTHFD